MCMDMCTGIYIDECVDMCIDMLAEEQYTQGEGPSSSEGGGGGGGQPILVQQLVKPVECVFEEMN